MKLKRVAGCAGFLIAASGLLRPVLLLPETSIACAADADAGSGAKLASAIRAGDLDAVKEALAAGADINALDSRKMPPIGAAALLGKNDIVAYLAEKGADVNRNDGFGYTPLMCAAIRGQSGAAKILLKYGADPALKGTNGGDALTCASPKGPADPLWEGKTAVKKLLQDAISHPREGGLAPVKAVPLPDPVPVPTPAPQPGPTPAPQPGPAPEGVEDATFDDVHFKIPDPKIWKSAVKSNNLVFSAELPAPDFCTVTIFASRDLPGDSSAFSKAFSTAVDAELQAQGVEKIEKDSGPDTNPTPGGGELTARQVTCLAKDTHTFHFFVGIHTSERLEFIAFQASSQQAYDQHRDQVSKFLKSVKVEVRHTLAPAPKKPADAPDAPAPEQKGGGIGSLLDTINKQSKPAPQ